MFDRAQTRLANEADANKIEEYFQKLEKASKTSETRELAKAASEKYKVIRANKEANQGDEQVPMEGFTINIRSNRHPADQPDPEGFKQFEDPSDEEGEEADGNQSEPDHMSDVAAILAENDSDIDLEDDE